MDEHDKDERDNLHAATEKGLAEGAKEAGKVALAAAIVATIDPTQSVGSPTTVLARVGGAAGVGVLAWLLLNNDTARVTAAIRAEQARALADVAPRIEAQWKELRDRGHAPSESDVAGVYGHWNEAWMNADPRTRRILKHAFVGAFDPDLYESGVLNDLFRVLVPLSYGDLRLLALAIRDEHVPPEAIPVGKDGLSADRRRFKNELGLYHLEKLKTARLVTETSSSESYTVVNTTHPVKRIIATPLGRKLAQLVAEANLADELGEM